MTDTHVLTVGGLEVPVYDGDGGLVMKVVMYSLLEDLRSLCMMEMGAWL